MSAASINRPLPKDRCAFVCIYIVHIVTMAAVLKMAAAFVRWLGARHNVADDRRLPSEIPRRRASGGTHHALGEARESLLVTLHCYCGKSPSYVFLQIVILWLPGRRGHVFVCEDSHDNTAAVGNIATRKISALRTARDVAAHGKSRFTLTLALKTCSRTCQSPHAVAGWSL